MTTMTKWEAIGWAMASSGITIVAVELLRHFVREGLQRALIFSAGMLVMLAGVVFASIGNDLMGEKPKGIKDRAAEVTRQTEGAYEKSIDWVHRTWREWTR